VFKNFQPYGVYTWYKYICGCPKSAYYAGVSIFDSLSYSLKSVLNKSIHFKVAFKGHVNNTHLLG